jgi:pyruvate ferredoxin oxidoreductase gamma subunit
MFEVRIHGRGEQGPVTGAEMLSIAAFIDGKYAQAFPSFGSERTGVPVRGHQDGAGADLRRRRLTARRRKHAG